MKILVDGRILGYFGPGEYLKNLIINLALLDRKNKYIVIINKQTPPVLYQDNFYFFKVPSFVKPYSIWEQVLIPVLIKHIKPDIAYFPNFNVPVIKCCPYLVTIHDIIYLLYPKDAPSYLSFCYARFMLKYAAKSADMVVTDSEHSRRDIIRHLKVPEEKIFNISGSVADSFTRMDKTYARTKIRETYGIKKDFILYVGNHHYHKNILTLIDAYGRLKEKIRYNLVIAGKDNRRTEILKSEVKKRKLEKDVIFAGFVPSDDLPLLYNAAACFVFPSLYEGFGLPPLEAMSCGIPVIASNKGSLREVLGEAAVFIDPLNTEELKKAIERVLTDPRLYRQLQEEGRKQSELFSWVKTVEKFRSIIMSLSITTGKRKAIV